MTTSFNLTTTEYTLLASGPGKLVVDFQSTGAIRLVVAASLPAIASPVFIKVVPDIGGRVVSLLDGQNLYASADPLAASAVTVTVTQHGDLVFSPALRTVTGEIANGQSVSGTIDLGNAKVVGIVMPPLWTAANLTFRVSWNGTEWNNLHDADGTEVTYAAAASRRIVVPVDQWLGVRYVQVRSGTSGAPVNQGAARTLRLIGVV